MRQFLKHSVTTGIAIVALGGTALAADLGEYQAPEPADQGFSEAQPAGPNWTGFQAGVDLGYGWGKAKGSLPGGAYKDTDGGAVGGGHVGYNVQVAPNVVVGAEADLMATDIKPKSTVGGATVENEIDWMSTVRGKAGVTIDQFLVYGTGGAALAGVKTTVPTGSDRETKLGWTLGAGTEAMLTENVSTRVEYLYSDFGKDTAVIGNTPVSTDLNTHILRGGLSYKF